MNHANKTNIMAGRGGPDGRAGPSGQASFQATRHPRDWVLSLRKKINKASWTNFLVQDDKYGLEFIEPFALSVWMSTRDWNDLS